MLTLLYDRIVRPVARAVLPPPARTIRGGLAAGLRFAARDVSAAFFDGSYERPIQEVLRRQLQPGDVFYDVGANVGFFTILAAKLVGSGGHVHAFEPVASNVETIHRNVRLNRWSNVSIHPVAVAAASGRQELLLTRHGAGSSLASAGVTVPDVADRVVVDTVALDDLVEQGKAPPPDVVKVDVEGAEIDVLRGMQRTLRTRRPAVLYEVDDAEEKVMRGRWAMLDAFLADAGYRIERLEHVYPSGGWQVGHSLALPA